MILARRERRETAPIFWCALIASGAAGCSASPPGDKLPRQPVAGTVLIDGRRLPSGSILFFPTHHAILGTAVAAGTVIEDGRFSIPWDKGLVPGKYRIAISSAGGHREQADSKTEPATPAIVHDEAIPARFNVETELEVEVKAGGIKHMTIEIDSK